MILSSLGLAEKSRSVLLGKRGIRHRCFRPHPCLTFPSVKRSESAGGVTPAVPPIHQFLVGVIGSRQPVVVSRSAAIEQLKWRQLCLPTLGRSVRRQLVDGVGGCSALIDAREGPRKEGASLSLCTLADSRVRRLRVAHGHEREVALPLHIGRRSSDPESCEVQRAVISRGARGHRFLTRRPPRSAPVW